MDEQTLREQAWIGDAILSLYAREWILQYVQSGSFRGELFARFTSNQFLSGLGEPTRIEAQIGKIYQDQGISAAFQHITHQILPLFVKQLKKQIRNPQDLKFNLHEYEALGVVPSIETKA